VPAPPSVPLTKDRALTASRSLPRGDAMTRRSGDYTRLSTGLCALRQVRCRAGTRVGMTRYPDIRCDPGRCLPFAVEIGGRAAGSAQRRHQHRSQVLLLPTRVREWHVTRSISRRQSQRTFEVGIRAPAPLRGRSSAWQPSQVVGEDDGFRDTVCSRFIDTEWSKIATHLATLLR